ncbi:hypothetical protein MP638_003836 [Amoeboaphelidium occidentale]|nr:hypothetical protein MP638_003836 [Amoeboaphelidium occidentale]
MFLRKLLLPFGCFGSSCVNEGNTEVGTAGPVLPEVGEQYNGTSGYEILRAVAKQQLDSTVSLADVHNLRAASKYINEDIMVANEHRKAKALSHLRNSCPSEFREKALRELFQESPRIPSWPRGDVVTEYYKKEVSVFFNNTNEDQVDQCLESVELLCASKFNSTKLKYLKWDAGNLVYRVNPAVATITTILDQCHNLQYLEMSNLLNDCYAQILSSFPVGLKHLAIKELALDDDSSNALDAYLARSSNLESLAISYIRYVQTFPFLPRKLKKLILIPLGYQVRGYIMPNLKGLTELRELVSGYSLNYMSFYQRIPRSVTDLHLRVSSDGSKILHDIIGQLKTLTIECDIWAPGIHHWIEFFQDSNVKTAGFRHCWTPDGSSPKGILNIETLLLEGNKFYDPGRSLISLLSSKARLPYLKHVSMKTQNDFMEAVMINSTVNYLKEFPSLKSLDIFYSKRGPFGMDQISFDEVLLNLQPARNDIIIIGH